MPLEEYTYEEQESGRSDTLVKAIERIEKLEKQLEVAVNALRDIYEWADDECFKATDIAEKALRQIKELEK